MTENSYESFPYTSEPYHQTHIAHLFLVARLFNLAPTDFKQARILELGCGAGGNLIPMADQYPGSTFIGIDLSARQIGQGHALIAALGLSNIILRAESIVDFPESAGLFDYIICHGTFSWVPSEVRRKILEIVSRHLAPQGLALVSYNAYPGWYGPSMLRDMMLFHTAGCSTPIAKVTEARNLLQFIFDAQAGDSGGYRAMLQAELANVRGSREEYVFHEYLEENNHPFYFQEFTNLAGQHGLAHLSDSDLGLAHLANYPSVVRLFLEAMNDAAQRDQYLDFVNNTRFRHSILVRQGLNRHSRIEPFQVEEFWVESEARPVQTEPERSLSPGAAAKFIGPNQHRFSIQDTLGAAMLLTLFHHRGRALRIDDLVAKAKDRFDLQGNESDLRRRFSEFALRFALSRIVVLRADPGRHVTTVSRQPIGLPAARILAKTSASVPNALHEVVMLDRPCQWLLPRLDGVTELGALAVAACGALGRGELVARYEAVPGMVPPTVPALAEAFLDHALSSLAGNALLIG